MQNIPLNQLSPELIQMLLTQGMFQPIEQANPYVNMIDPNMNQLAYNINDFKKQYGVQNDFNNLTPQAQRALLNIQFNNPNLINKNDSLYQVDKRAFRDYEFGNAAKGGDTFDAPQSDLRTQTQRSIYESIQKGRL